MRKKTVGLMTGAVRTPNCVASAMFPCRSICHLLRGVATFMHGSGRDCEACRCREFGCETKATGCARIPFLFPPVFASPQQEFR